MENDGGKKVGEKATPGVTSGDSGKKGWREKLEPFLNPITPEEQEAFDRDMEGALAKTMGSLYNPIKRFGMFIGYKKTAKAIVLLLELPFVLWVCWTIYSVFASGAYACVHFQPLVAHAQDCLDMNNASDEHPTAVYIPQMDCRAIYQDGLPRYNMSVWEAKNFSLPVGVPAYKVEVNKSG